MDATRAKAKFESGPASATSMLPRFAPTRSRCGFTGVGFPQPTPTMTRNAVPTGSRCASGFSVSRPWRLAVLSPSSFATHAWLNSWKAMPVTSAIAIAAR